MTCTSGTSCDSTIQTGRPFDSVAFLNRRQRQFRRRPERRRLRSIRSLLSEAGNSRRRTSEDCNNEKPARVHCFALRLDDEFDATIAGSQLNDRGLHVRRGASDV